MLVTLIVIILVLAAGALTYTLTRGRSRRALTSDEANEVYAELRGGKHRRPITRE